MLAYERPVGELGRFVLLAPPNQGSASADRMTRMVGWLLAPIAELRTTGTVRGIPPPEIEFAIIAGRNDGKVSVEETCLTGARHHLLVRSAHTFIMLPPSTHEIVEGFLRTGEVEDEVERVPEGLCSR